MTTSYDNLSKLLSEIGTKVLRKILEHKYKSAGILNFGNFLDVNKHRLYHGWKPDVTCCDPECMHLARRSRALISDHQWDLLYKRIGHHHGTRYPFCPCQYIKSNVTLSGLDMMTSSQILRITSSTLSSNVRNAITELTIVGNNLFHVKSTTRFDTQHWRSTEQAILTLAEVISANYYQEIKEEINRLHSQGNILSDFSDWGSSFTDTGSVGTLSTASSPPTTSTDLMIIDEKLQEIQEDIQDIKADVYAIKQSHRVPFRHAKSEKDLVGTDTEVKHIGPVIEGLEARINANMFGLFSKWELLFAEMSEKLEKLVDNEKMKDEGIDKISSKLKDLESQNIDVNRKLDDIHNLTKSRTLVRETVSTGNQPVSVYNVRNLKDTVSPAPPIGPKQRKLLPRDGALTEFKIQEDSSYEKEGDSTSSTEPRKVKRVYIPRKQNVEENQNVESNTFDGEVHVKKTANVPIRNRGDPVTTNVEGGKVIIPDDRSVIKQSFKDSGYQSFSDQQNQKLTLHASDRIAGIEDHSENKYTLNSLHESSADDTSGDPIEGFGMTKISELDIIQRETDAHKPHTIGDIPGDSRTLVPHKIDSIQKGTSVQSEISTELDCERETISGLIDEELDNAIKRGELAVEPENGDIQKMPSLTRTSVSSAGGSSSTNGAQKEETEEGRILNLLDLAGLPHTDEFKDIVEQAIKAHSTEQCRSVGMDTVICIDASDSLKGKVGDQMKSVVLYLTNYIENTAITRGLEENIGIVVFGKENKVLQVLTNNYVKVRQAIEQVTIGGTSPLLTGLLLSYIAIEISGGATSILGHIVNPRIILLTDGRPTDDTLMNDLGIENSEKSPEVKKKNIEFAEKLYRKGYSIYCVAIGQSSNRDFLTELSTVSDGSMFNMDSTEELGKFFQYHNIVGKVVSRLPEQYDSIKCEDILTDELKQNAPDFCTEDTLHIKDILKTEGIRVCEEFDSLPPLGRLVCERAASSGIKIGTVIKHTSRQEVTVLWDDDGKEEDIKIRAGAKHIEVIDGPRKLRDGELIREGVRVTRGAAWKNEYGNVDGGIGESGLVFRITNDGLFKVRWDNGRRGNYRYDGVVEKRNEIQVHSSSVCDPFGKKTLSLGMLVSPAVLGTAFRVGERYVMTAYHLIKEMTAQLQIKFLVKTKEGEIANVFESFYLKPTATYCNVDLDIAVLELEECDRPYPPALEMYTNIPKFSLTENLNIIGFGQDGYLHFLKCKVYPSKKTGILERSVAEELLGEQLDKYRQITDPNKIILRSSHWQNGMDGAVGLAEIENEYFVVLMYLKAFEQLQFGQAIQKQLGIDSSSVIKQGIFLKTINDSIIASNPELSKTVLLKEVKMKWQIQLEDWVDFTPDVSDKLEMSFIHRGDKTCIVTFREFSIRVLFPTMQARYTVAGYTVSVRRIMRDNYKNL